ncbi:Tim44/TimA family putative adaptor protein [Pontibaca methylaminivorans]|uniref:Tim44/TimA family putative adaptor protein n=1 Tax=Pontibaca methylaminivorans TaxID=515897 RepID=UPI002FD8ED47
MNSPIIQLLVLAGIAIFLIWRLRNVLGTREGFEKPAVPQKPAHSDPRPEFEVIEGGPDRDITDHVAEGSPEAEALAQMKRVEPAFSVTDFVQGARSAYEMIVTGFDKGDLDGLRPLLDEDVHASFAEAVRAREEQGLKIESEFIGVRETVIREVSFQRDSNLAEVTMRFVGELTSVVRNAEGEIVEGNPSAIKRQTDVWTFARTMGAADPNWRLVATGS